MPATNLIYIYIYIFFIFIFLPSILTSPKEFIWCTNYANVYIHVLCKCWSFTEYSFSRWESLKWNSLIQTTRFWKKHANQNWNANLWQIDKDVFNYWSSHWRCSIEKGVVKVFFVKKILQQKFFLWTLQNNSYFEEDLRTAALRKTIEFDTHGKTLCFTQFSIRIVKIKLGCF